MAPKPKTSMDKLSSLERNFVFYGAYHNEPVNQAIHIIFVPTLLTTAMVFFTYIDVSNWLPASTASVTEAYLPSVIGLNGALPLALAYALFYLYLSIPLGV